MDARFVLPVARGAQDETAMGQTFGATGVEHEIAAAAHGERRADGGADVAGVDRLLERPSPGDETHAPRPRLAPQRGRSHVVPADHHRYA